MEYECPRCGYTTIKKSNIDAHIFKKNKMCPPSKYDCDKSELILLYNKMVQEKAENIEENYVCYFCMKAFSNRQSRINHYKSAHQTEYTDIIKIDK